MIKLQKTDLAKIRIYKSGLVKPFGDVSECLRRLFGVQSQAQQFGEISILNRLENLSAPQLQKMYAQKSIIKIWGQRMTVHMYRAQDWKTVHKVYAHRNNFVKRGWAGNEKILGKTISEIEKAAKEKDLTKKEVCSIIEKNASSVKDFYRDYGIILKMTLDGIIFGIPCMPQIKYFSHRSRALQCGTPSEWASGRDKAYEYILLNYLENYGPASKADFRHWSGLSQKEAAPVFEKVRDKLREYDVEGKTYYALKNDKDTAKVKNSKIKEVRLLGKFDPLFVSFSDKTWIADAKQQKAIWRPAGHVEAVLLEGGEIAGTWRYAVKGGKMDFNIELFRKTGKEAKKQAALQAEKIASYLSKETGKIKYS